MCQMPSALVSRCFRLRMGTTGQRGSQVEGRRLAASKSDALAPMLLARDRSVRCDDVDNLGL
jgi:hypothetical protein